MMALASVLERLVNSVVYVSRDEDQTAKAMMATRSTVTAAHSMMRTFMLMFLKKPLTFSQSSFTFVISTLNPGTCTRRTLRRWA